MSSADISRPFERRTGRLPVVSRLISRIARMGLSRVMSRMRNDGSSSIRSTIAAVPTFSTFESSDMLESPTITCSRLYVSASAWGSSLVLMMGRERVVADDTPSQMCSARWDRQNTGPLPVLTIFPAPDVNWRDTRNGMNCAS